MNLKSILLLSLYFISFTSFATPEPANKIFNLTTQAQDPNTFVLNWTIKSGYFLYKDRINLTSEKQSNLQIKRLDFPKPEEKIDHQGRHLLIYRNQLTIPASLVSDRPGETLIEVHYQGCSDDGFCYPPQIKQIKLSINSQLQLTDASIEPAEEIAKPEIPSTTTPTKYDNLFSSSGWAFIILSFFGFGLLLSFTPCVLPMIPVLSGIIVGHGPNLSTRKAFFLSLSYVMSMSITYGVIGGVIALLGSNIQIVMQSSWVIGIFSFVFILLALAMFNLYELQLPVSWQSRLAKVTRGQASGHYLSAAIMGCMSILILSPCVTAPLIGALSYIAQTGDMILGLFSLFFLGLGMGTPLLLIGTSAGKLLPKAGQWMNAVKAMFGVLLLAVAIHLLSRLLPSFVSMGLWAALLIFTGIFLEPFHTTSTPAGKFRQGLGIILLAYGLLILYGASQGQHNPLHPLQATIIEQSSIPPSSATIVKTLAEAKDALAEAQNNHLPVVLDFYADWCESCKVIAHTTLQHLEVKQALQEVMMIQVDLTANNANSRDLLTYFHVVAPPTFLFYDAAGNAQNGLQLVGHVSDQALLDRLSQIIASK